MKGASRTRVLAVGAWLKNAACLLDGPTAHWSAPHGDLADPAACLALERSLDGLLMRGPIDAIAHDLHPDFHSTRLAIEIAQRLGVPAIGVQHHHAHIAVLQAEQQAAQRRPEPMIGLALDGVGLGTDGLAWGGELLFVDGARWQRLGHLSPLALPGGDVAAREPWRMAAAAMFAIGEGASIDARFAPHVGSAATSLLYTMLQRRLNTPTTTSAGRWFDAAAGALGFSVRQAVEAEAAIAMELAATEWLDNADVSPHAEFTPILANGQLDLRPLFAHLLTNDDEPARGAAVFHVNLAAGLARWAIAAARQHAVGAVALGGGCFMNRVLTQRLGAHLEGAGLRVLRTRSVSCGDAGLALGQAWVAADQLRRAAAAGLPATLHTLTEASPCA
ncbi:MAG: carbamoyltransferase HypF [Pseudomonadota bacterium]